MDEISTLPSKALVGYESHLKEGEEEEEQEEQEEGYWKDWNLTFSQWPKLLHFLSEDSCFPLPHGFVMDGH